MKLVTVATFTNAPDLYITKGSLENEGIPCFVKDEHTLQSNPLYDIAIGGMKLQVEEQHAQKALEILKEVGYYDKNRGSSYDMSNIIKANTIGKIILAIILITLLFLVC
jgi:hypothetical protein